MKDILNTICAVLYGKELYIRKANDLLNKAKIQIVYKGYGLDLLLIGFVLVIGMHIFFPSIVEAVVDPIYRPPYGKELEMEIDSMMNKTRSFGALAVADEGQPNRVIKVPVTAYSSDPEQTDSSPFITASGTQTRHGVVAANFLPIGTRVRFPEIYGDQIFIVEDRMNKRYNKHVDIWMAETADAMNFGLQWTDIEIFSM